MKITQISTLAIMVCSFSIFNSCSSDDSSNLNEDDETIVVTTPVVSEPVIEEPTPVDSIIIPVDPIVSETLPLAERFIFDDNIVIENSYNTDGCDTPPCDTVSESIIYPFTTNNTPNDPYFYLSDDESLLNLECQLEKGRRIEFKQSSEGPLTSLSKLTFEGAYYDVPDNGVTIAQVHNRGGSSNKPFFRLVLYKDGLETVIRKDPEVSSSDTSFQKEDFSFVDGADYDTSSLKIILEKNDGFVHISVEQNEVIILDESYTADITTDWVNDNGIANGFYLKAGLYNDDGPHTKSLVVGYTTVVFESDDI